MAQRNLTHPRCSLCGLHLELCICSQIPTLTLSTSFVFVQHTHEIHKPTNTGRIAHHMLRSSTLISYGPRHQDIDTSSLDEEHMEYYLLYPRADAALLSPPIEPENRSICIVVLDGTWHQCSRMARRVPRVRELPCVALPQGSPSQWGVRTPPNPAALCTFEAVIRVIEIFHGSQTAQPMQAVFNLLCTRMMAMRGKML